VITTVPHYPSGKVPAAWRGKWIWRSSENGVEVLRIGLPSINRAHLSHRLLPIFVYQVRAAVASLGQRDYDVVLACGPFLAVLLPYAWSVSLRHKPAVYSVNDVYPDVGIKMGIFKHKLVISTVAALERFCLNHASVVQIISESFRPSLRNLGVPDTKMTLVYNWVDTDLIHPLSHDNAFAQEHGLTNHFVVSYAGNIGLSQGLEHLLDVAGLLADQKEIRFIFVGDGPGRELLQNQAKQSLLPNVQFIPYQPRERLPEVLACADVSLVVLRRGFGSNSLPSKTFSIMASGRPIVASVDEESETSKLVKRAEAGLCVPPEDPEKLAKAIINLKEDKELCERYGRNGRLWAEQHHSPQYAAEQFEKLFLEAITSHKSRR
jgi:colanic acid biosynthesis glycosyl transferase WcaI